MMLTCSLPPTNFDRPSIKLRAFSSSSRTRSAILGLLISSAAQTSAATNHGSPSMTITRSGFSSKEKIDGTCVPAIFSFEEKSLRVIFIDGEPWFVAADVCAALEISNPSMALRVLDDDEKALSLIEGLSKLVGGNEQVNIINDSGLYTLTLRCRDAVKKGSLPH